MANNLYPILKVYDAHRDLSETLVDLEGEIGVYGEDAIYQIEEFLKSDNWVWVDSVTGEIPIIDIRGFENASSVLTHELHLCDSEGIRSITARYLPETHYLVDASRLLEECKLIVPKVTSYAADGFYSTSASVSEMTDKMKSLASKRTVSNFTPTIVRDRLISRDLVIISPNTICDYTSTLKSVIDLGEVGSIHDTDISFLSVNNGSIHRESFLNLAHCDGNYGIVDINTVNEWYIEKEDLVTSEFYEEVVGEVYPRYAKILKEYKSHGSISPKPTLTARDLLTHSYAVRDNLLVDRYLEYSESDAKFCGIPIPPKVTPETTQVLISTVEAIRNKAILKQRRVIDIYLLDKDPALDPKDSLIASYHDVATEHPDNLVIQELIMDPKAKVYKALGKHNARRKTIVNKLLLHEHGKRTTLEPIKPEDIEYLIK